MAATGQALELERLRVELGPRSYDIRIGTGLLSSAWAEAGWRGRHTLVVSDSGAAPLWWPRLAEALATSTALDNPQLVVLKAGEQHKNLAALERIWQRLLAQQYDRHSLVIALGGGLVGDISGFAAATYQRGIDIIQVPTTLLAQVDSSVGGKTAINHEFGKNLIGAFHQPLQVVIDLDTLRTLPPREYVSGLAEVIKYGAILDRAFFDRIERQLDALLAKDAKVLAAVIARCCQIKAEVVATDELDLTGRRALLNFGHSFGHAIEAFAYGDWLHGEAIAAGMCMAASVSVADGRLTVEEERRLERLLVRAGLPTRPPRGMGVGHFENPMKLDKKMRAGRLHLVLLDALGKACCRSDYDEAARQRTLASFTAAGN